MTLEVDGQSHTQQLRVLKDPNSTGTEADIRAQLAMVSELRDDYNAVADMVNRIEWTRRQIYDLRAMLDDGDQADMLTASDELDNELIAVEGNLIRLLTTGTGQDGVGWAPKLAEEIRYLAGAAATADFRRTDQMGEVHAILRERLNQYRADVDRLFERSVASFNRTLLDRDLAPLNVNVWRE